MVVAILSIKLLGEFTLSYREALLTSVTADRLQALLAYLLLHSDVPQPRQLVAVQLWPDTTDAEAKANLRRRLHDLRRHLPDIDQWLRIETKTVHWQSDDSCQIDVIDFERAIAQASHCQQAGDLAGVNQALSQAADLYQGDLLPVCYDDWIVSPREQLRQQAIQVHDQLISRLTDLGQTREAMPYAQRLLRLDRLYEPAYCHLMRLHAQDGDRAGALRVYHQCMTVLRDELGVSPSPTTCKLYEHLLTLEDQFQTDQSRRTPTEKPFCEAPDFSVTRPDRRPEASLVSPPAALAFPLIGRQPEWALMQRWAAQTDSPSCELLLLLGEPGIGKTRLLEELANQVGATGGYVLWGRGFAAEMQRPYGVWIDAFRAIQANEFLAELARLTTAPAMADQGLNRSRLFDAGAQFLTQLASDYSTVLVVLDDIQWLDEGSVSFLHYVARILRHVAVRFACAARKQELELNPAVAKFLQSFQREHRLQRIEVKPLDPAHTAELAHRIRPDLSGEEIFLDSGGNPLFTLEIARAWSESTALFSSDLATLIQGRFEQLEEPARDLIAWAAALGRSFNPTILGQVASYPLPQLLTAVEQLEQHGMIRPSSSGQGECDYDFVHDIVRQIAYQQLSEPRRRLVHLHIAQALNGLVVSQPGLIGDVAHHASLAGDRLLAATACLGAAERSLRLFGYAEASGLAQQGLQQCQTLAPATRLPLQLRLRRVYVKAGVRTDQVSQLEAELQHLIEEAAALGLKDEEAIGLETLIILSYDHGKLTQVQQHSLQAAERGRSASPTTTAYMLAHTGSCLAEIGRDIPRAEALLLEAQSLADRVGLQTIDIPFGLGCIRRYQGDWAESRQWLEQGWEMAQRTQDHWRECTCLTNLVMLELEVGNTQAACDYCDALITVTAQMGEGSEAPHAAALNALAHYMLGQPGADDPLARSRQTLIKMDSPRMLAYVQTLAAEYDLQQGRLKSAIARAEEALAAAQVVNNASDISLAWAVIIQASLTLGNANCAQQHFQKLTERVKEGSLNQRATLAMQHLRQQLE
jgi:DNA-binding SARP family transcriptional activator